MSIRPFAAAVGLSLLVASPAPAQDPGRMLRDLPVMRALDIDRDGTLSSKEIEGAVTALRTIDKDGNGKLTADELMPAGGPGGPGRGGRPPRGERPGGPGRPGPGGPGPGGPGPGMLRMIPLITALDVDGDDEISAEEWKDAASSLRTLDRDDDDRLAGDELMPAFGPPPGGRGGFGGPGGFGGEMGPRKQPSEVDPKDGTATIPDRAAFKRLSYQGAEVMIDTQLTGLEFVKFVVADAGTDHAVIYFMNTQTHRAHPMFTRLVGVPHSMGRRGASEPGAGTAMMGVLVFRPMLASPSGKAGLYTFEFEPNDAYPFALIKVAHDLLAEFAPLVAGNLAYHPLQAAVGRYQREKDEYESADLHVFLDEELFDDIAYLPLHAAEGYGRLRVMAAGERPGVRDVVLYRSLPNEMPRVAGIITAARQTPLSHVNLRAVQDDVPNAYVRDAAENAAITALIGKYVRYVVAADGYELREATSDEVDAHFAALRPAAAQMPVRDLSVETIRPLAEIAFADSKAFGTKVANLAALRAMDLPAGVVPDGFGIPFHFYDAFMKHNGFYADITAMQTLPGFVEDVDLREKELASFRTRIAKGTMPKWMAAALADLRKSFPAGTAIRCRSSTNTEDLPGFSGAGLYDSFTHRPTEGPLGTTIKEVFASLWNLRAYEEREFYRIDHLTAAMGVLVHPNYSAERANGVAVTDDIVYQTSEQSGRRYYVNVQVGEDLVTNPQAESIPEEILLHPSSARRDTQVRLSNRVPPDTSILSEEHVTELRRSLNQIHRRFRTLYGHGARDQFAIEVEFKITADGALAIKQARPWVY